MIGPGNGVRVFLAAGTTDMRCGSETGQRGFQWKHRPANGLCARAKKVLEEDPAGGAMPRRRQRGSNRWRHRWQLLEPVAHHGSIIRGRMGDRLKMLHWDGQGFCLYYKVLERGHFPWPKATEGKISLTSGQLSMLWEDEEDQQTVQWTVCPTNDWRQPRWTSAPTRM